MQALVGSYNDEVATAALMSPMYSPMRPFAQLLKATNTDNALLVGIMLLNSKHGRD